MAEKVVITGMGVASPLGCNLDDFEKPPRMAELAGLIAVAVFLFELLRLTKKYCGEGIPIARAGRETYQNEVLEPVLMS